MRRHYLTTIFGILTLIGGAIGTTERARSSPNWMDIATVLTHVGTAGIGFSAADARQTRTQKEN